MNLAPFGFLSPGVASDQTWEELAAGMTETHAIYRLGESYNTLDGAVLDVLLDRSGNGNDYPAHTSDSQRAEAFAEWAEANGDRYTYIGSGFWTPWPRGLVIAVMRGVSDPGVQDRMLEISYNNATSEGLYLYADSNGIACSDSSGSGISPVNDPDYILGAGATRIYSVGIDDADDAVFYVGNELALRRTYQPPDGIEFVRNSSFGGGLDALCGAILIFEDWPADSSKVDEIRTKLLAEYTAFSSPP